MRAILNSEGLGLLPSDLAAVVVPVDKLTNNVGKTESASSVTTASDKLWLFSANELAGPLNQESMYEDGYEWLASIFNAEGSPYKLFIDSSVNPFNDNTILKKNQEASYWWNRSPSPTISTEFFNGYEGEPLHNRIATESNGVVPGFCI